MSNFLRNKNTKAFDILMPVVPGTSVLSLSESRVTFLVASRVPSTVSHFKTEPGTSLEMLQWARASSSTDGGPTCFFSSCGRILELRWGIQVSSCVGPGKSNLPFELQVRAGDCSRSHCRAKQSSSRFVSRTEFFSPGATGISGLHSKLTWGVRPRLQGSKGLRSPLESHRVFLGPN